MILSSAPQYVSWNYTYACNLSCDHCYSRSDRYPRELSEEQYRQIAIQLLHANVFTVALGGGEPILRRDCVDTVGVLSKNGVDVHLTSSGWFLDEHMCDSLAQAGLGKLFISLDSAEEATHDKLRGRAGVYKRAIAAIERASRLGHKVRISTVITSLNDDKLEDIVAIAASSGAVGIEFKRFRPSGNGLQNRRDLEISEERRRNAIYSIRQSIRDAKIEIVVIDNEQNGAPERCPCGIRSICIRPNGDVTPCPYVETVIGNLMTSSLKDLWSSSPQLIAFRTGSCCSAALGNISPSNPSGALNTDDLLPVLNLL